MPCTGPSQEQAYKNGELVYKELIQKLIKEYGIVKPKKASSRGYIGRWEEEYLETVKALEQNIKELIWISDCLSF